MMRNVTSENSVLIKTVCIIVLLLFVINIINILCYVAILLITTSIITEKNKMLPDLATTTLQ
jgi:hypothetical protein